jgi:hypothetical protein
MRLATLLALAISAPPMLGQSKLPDRWLWTRAYAIPKETTSEGSGYFSIIEGKNGRLYIGTAKYGQNAYLVEFDPETKVMRVVVDAQQAIGTPAVGFAAQSKIHTRNNVGESGRIYFGTKQGYPKDGEKRTDYPGGFPMVFDPATGQTRVYDIPVKHHGIISVTPDESRSVAYISTCSDERPIESTHFMILDLKTGKYRDLMECRHMYAFIVVDYLGRAYHPILGGDIARYDPVSERLERLKQTIDGMPPSVDTWLAHAESHPINWDTSPDRKTLYAVAMSGNQLYAYDLAAPGNVLAGRRLGKLIADAKATDCRAMCVGPAGEVWMGVAATFVDGSNYLHLVGYRPGDPAPRDYGPIAVRNPDYTTLTDAHGKPLPFHHGMTRAADGALIPRYVIMGVCQAKSGAVYLTTLAPFTVHEIWPGRKKVAAVVTTWYQNSHADVIAGRLLETDTLDGKGRQSPLELVSLYTDQVPANDISRRLAKKHGVPIHETPAKALTLGTGRLAVDGVLLIAEHGDYPQSDTGQFQYPKRRLFGEIVETFRRSGRPAPVFIDKHLSDTWTDAKWIYDTARAEWIPLMAGSSVPVLWRRPPTDVRRDAKLKEVFLASYHRLDSYGFHALETLQALVEPRTGGETGVRRVRCLVKDAVWKAEDDGVYDTRLFEAALKRMERAMPPRRELRQLVPEPVLFVIEYADGLRAFVLTLNPIVGEWAGAWRYEDGSIDSTVFATQEARPFMHFTYLLHGIESMMLTGSPAWPVERTLMTSGQLDALLLSKRAGGEWRATRELLFAYRTAWRWSQPPPPPPGRPLDESIP